MIYNCGRMPRMNMGARIKELLKARGWKQSDLLERVPDLDAKSLSAVINRDSRFSEYALGIAKGLGVSLDYLIFGVEDHATVVPAPSADPVLGITTDEVVELLRLYGACDQAGRNFIRDAARARLKHSTLLLTDQVQRGA